MPADRTLRWQRSATLRIALIHSAAILLATMLLGAFVVHRFHITVEQQVDQRIVDDARSLVHHHRRGGRPGLLRTMTQRADMMPDLVRGLFDRNGGWVAGSALLAAEQPGWHSIMLRTGSSGIMRARALAVRLDDGSTVMVAAADEVVDAAAAPITRLFIFQALAVAMLGVISALLLSRYLRRRLETIADTARAIMVGRIEQRMPVGKGDEFDHLAAILNAMLDKIGALIANLRQVSSDIAHDLRTPLTRLRAEAERAAAAWERPEQARARMESVLAQTDEALAIFAALLRISEIEAGAGQRGFVPIDLSMLVTELSESYEPALREGGRTLRWQVEQGIMLPGDRQLLAQMVVNLVENAATHTPLGTMIHVSLSRTDHGPMLRVRDDGPGIAVADRTRALQRFGRLEASRGAPGHGLGLSLVAAIAALHGLKLELGDAGPGLLVTLGAEPSQRA